MKTLIFILFTKFVILKKKGKTANGIETFNFDEKPNYNKKAKTIYNYDIIVIDESSMITLDMLKHLHAIKRKIRGKIIFVGIIIELPPVNENESIGI